MSPPSTSAEGARRLARAAGILLLVCQTGMLVALAAHRSTEPRILDRYSPGFAALLVASSLALVSWAVFLAARWQRLDRDLTALVARLASVPGLLEMILLAWGLAPVGLWFLGPIVASLFADPRILWSLGVSFAGVLVLVLRLAEPRRSDGLRQNLTALFLGTVTAGLTAEVALRAYSGTVPYRILPPGLERRLEFAPGVAPGIDGPSAFRTDELGIRGGPFVADASLRILCIGGSTTMNAYLDDRETWPHLLQEELASERRERVWVGNVGRSGLGLVEHLYALRHFTPQLELDAVILLVGVNDLIPALKNPQRDADSENPENFRRFARSAFYSRPLVDPSMARDVHQSLAFWNLVLMVWQEVRTPLEPETASGTRTDFPSEARRRFQAAPKVIDQLPDLTRDLERYERNLALLIEEAARRRVRLILATQPALWRPDLPARAEKLLWMGVYGDYDAPAGRYTVAALHEGMARFNRRLLDVCRRHGVECVDLASRMTGIEEYFYDDVHFTEAGAREVAELLAEHLLAHQPPAGYPRASDSR